MKITITIFCIVIALSFLLRFYLIPQNLFFGPEQGRDFLVIKDIVYNHKLTLIGPKTDVPGVFHGPVFYYLSAIPFLLSKGAPVFVSGFLILLNSLTVIPLYILAKEMRNKRTGIIAALLFTFSFGAIVFARWLSNPPLSILLAVLFFLFLWRFLQGKQKYLFFAGVTFGLLGQVEFINFLIFATILLGIVIIFHKSFLKQSMRYLLLCFLVAAASSWVNFFLFDLRHDFLITKSLMELLSGKSGYYVSFADSFLTTMRVFLEVAKTVLVPFLIIPTVIILVGGTVVQFFFVKDRRKNSILLLWLFAPLVTFIFLRHDVLAQFFAASIAAIILIGAVFLDFIWIKNRSIGMLICLVLLGIHVAVFQQNIKENKHVFFQSTQPGLRIEDQEIVIDKIYGFANGEPFSLQSYTIPFWLQEGWVYLFWQYGATTYGYEPVSEKAKNLFVIVQDDPGSQAYQEAWLKNTVEKWGQEVHEFRVGILRVKQLHASSL